MLTWWQQWELLDVNMVAAVVAMGCLQGGSSRSDGILTWWQQWE